METWVQGWGKGQHLWARVHRCCKTFQNDSIVWAFVDGCWEVGEKGWFGLDLGVWVLGQL